MKQLQESSAHAQTIAAAVYASRKMAELFHFCSMCSYGTVSLETLTEHVCTKHKSDPRFLVYCNSCLCSYSKWDSYRKHLQRGCEIMPTSATASTHTQANSDREEYDDPGMSMDVDDDSSILANHDQQWHEAAYILSIKEKHILAQVAVDEILSITGVFVQDLLTGLVDDIQDKIPSDAVHILEDKVKETSDNLFRGISTAFLQKQYFRKHFSLVVS